VEITRKRQFNKRKFLAFGLLFLMVTTLLFTASGMAAQAQANGDVANSRGGFSGTGEFPEGNTDGLGKESRSNFSLSSLGGWLLEKSVIVLEYTVSEKLYTNIFFSDRSKVALMIAWKAVRDFVNMFFLLILIFLAISTILNISQFNDKKLFFKVLVSAILVNFSLPITLMVIDLSNILMNFFIDAIHQSSDGRALGVYFLDKVDYVKFFGNTSLMLRAGMNIMEFVVQVVMAVMLFYIAIALLIRLIAFWVLIVLSPLAFFTIALPNSNSFQEWKDKLINYAFFGPMMLLFIWIAVVLLWGINFSFRTMAADKDGGFLQFVVAYITVLYLLYYGHDKARDMASKAGDTVTKIMDHGGKWAVRSGKLAAAGGLIFGTGAAGLAVGSAGAYAGVKTYKTGKSMYKGLKKRLEESKWTRWMTKEGRKYDERVRDEKWEQVFAGADKKKAYEYKLADETLNAWREAGKDIDNEVFLEDRLKEGGRREQVAAAVQLARLGKLYGDRYAKAKEVAGDNYFISRAIDRGAKGNRVAEMNYKLEQYLTAIREGKEPPGEASKYFEINMKSLIGEYAEVNDDRELKRLLLAEEKESDEQKKREIVKEYISKFLEETQMSEKEAMQMALFSSSNSIDDVAGVANEKMSHKERQEIAEVMVKYLNDQRFGGERFVAGHNLDALRARLNPIAQTKLRGVRGEGGSDSGGRYFSGNYRRMRRREPAEKGDVEVVSPIGSGRTEEEKEKLQKLRGEMLRGTDKKSAKEEDG